MPRGETHGPSNAGRDQPVGPRGGPGALHGNTQQPHNRDCETGEHAQHDDPRDRRLLSAFAITTASADSEIASLIPFFVGSRQRFSSPQRLRR